MPGHSPPKTAESGPLVPTTYDDEKHDFALHPVSLAILPDPGSSACPLAPVGTVPTAVPSRRQRAAAIQALTGLACPCPQGNHLHERLKRAFCRLYRLVYSAQVLDNKSSSSSAGPGPFIISSPPTLSCPARLPVDFPESAPRIFSGSPVVRESRAQFFHPSPVVRVVQENALAL